MCLQLNIYILLHLHNFTQFMMYQYSVHVHVISNISSQSVVPKDKEVVTECSGRTFLACLKCGFACAHKKYVSHEPEGLAQFFFFTPF